MPELNVIWVEKSEYMEMGVKAHTHGYYQLYYVSGGKISFILENSTYNMEQGSCIIVPPSKTHGIKKTEAPATTLEIKFAVFGDDLKNDLAFLDKPAAVNPLSEHLIRYVIRYGRSRLPYLIHTVEHYFCTLIHHLTSEEHSIDTSRSNAQLIDTAGFSRVTVDIIIYIEENYMHDISLQALADSVGYHRNYICYAFKKDTGITIFDYLNFVRIRHAAELFSYSDVDISQVCTRVGFSNISHFNHTFKRLAGMPPGRYRRMFPADIYGNLDEGSITNALLNNQLKALADIFGTFSSNNAEAKPLSEE